MLGGRGGETFSADSIVLGGGAGTGDEDGSAGGSTPIPGCTGLKPSDTMPAKSKSSSAPPIEMRTEFLVDILRSNSLLLLFLGSIVAVASVREDKSVSARNQQHHQCGIDGGRGPGVVIDTQRCDVFGSEIGAMGDGATGDGRQTRAVRLLLFEQRLGWERIVAGGKSGE
jgi:hypothetical protein